MIDPRDTTHHNSVHPTAQIGPQVRLGKNITVGPYAVITGNTTIGDNTVIHAHAVIGTPAQDFTVTQPLGHVTIGSNCTIREFVTIHSPKTETGTTQIGNNCYLMNFTHIAHDVTLEDNVTMVNSAQIAGHAYIEHDVTLLGFSSVNKFCRIGAYTVLTPYTGARTDLPPYSMFQGAPAQFFSINRVKLKAVMDEQTRRSLQNVLDLFYHQKVSLEQIEQLEQKNNFITNFITFIKQSKTGVSRRSVK